MYVKSTIVDKIFTNYKRQLIYNRKNIDIKI